MKQKGSIYCVTAGHPKKIVKAVILSVIANLANLIPIGFLTIIVLTFYRYFSGSISSLDFHHMWIIWGIMAGSMVILYLLELAASHATYYGGYAAGASGRVELAEHIRKLPLGFLMSRDPGELGNTMMNDFSLIEDAMTHTLPQLISGAITAILGVIGMCFIDWRLGLALFSGLPITVIILLLVQQIDQKRGAAHVAAKLEQTNRLQEYLAGMKVIKAYNLSGRNFQKLDKAFRNFADESIRLEGVSGPFYLVAISFLQFGISAVTMTGAYLLSGDHLDIPVFVMFLFIGNRLFEPLVAAITQLPVFVYKKTAGKRIIDLMDEPAMTGDGNVPEHHDIRFDHVCFGYGDNAVLHDICATMTPGTMTAIVGPSGSGKSTMLRLIARFYDSESGVVRFGGVDEKNIDPETLMRKISVVFQDVYLFQDTIEANIRYGREDASYEDIVAAAKLARCHDFIMRLPDGYNTLIGEGGSTLSGGEKQRISIARAILKDAPVLLLDEATSSLDPENELDVQHALEQLVKGRTVIMIAHKLKTIANADQILVLDQGRIIEHGTHTELMKEDGLYAHLWKVQQETSGWQI